MNILIFAESITPYNNYLFNLIASEKDLNLYVVYRFSSDPLHFFKNDLPAKYEFETENKLTKSLKRKIRESDFILFIGIKSTAKKRAIICAVSSEKNFAYWCDTPPDNYFSGLKGKIKKDFFKYFLKKAKKNCTTGISGREFWIKNGFDESKITNLPFFWSLDIPAVSEEKLDVVKTFFQSYISEGDFVVCMSGKLVKSKGYDIAIKSAAYVLNKTGRKNIKFLICGEGPEREFLEELIKKNGIENNFFLLGWLDNEYLDFFHKKGNLFLHPALFDPFPNVVLKAMIYSLPVIGFDSSGSIKDRIINSKNGFIVKRDNIEEFNSGLLFCIQNPDKTAEMGKNARQTAEYWNDAKAIEIFRNIIS
jgi:glycosyltransferase involved in cell wall biosynthesis